jgi:hypothetical protein
LSTYHLNKEHFRTWIRTYKNIGPGSSTFRMIIQFRLWLFIKGYISCYKKMISIISIETFYSRKIEESKLFLFSIFVNNRQKNYKNPKYLIVRTNQHTSQSNWIIRLHSIDMNTKKSTVSRRTSSHSIMSIMNGEENNLVNYKFLLTSGSVYKKCIALLTDNKYGICHKTIVFLKSNIFNTVPNIILANIMIPDIKFVFVWLWWAVTISNLTDI